MKAARARLLEGLLTWTILTLAILLSMVPIAWLVIQSLIPGGFILDLSLETFKKISLANYAVILDPFKSEFFRSVRNSLVIGTASTILTLAVASLSGYAFARFRFNGSYNLKTWILSMRFFPAVSIVVPLYLIWIDLGLTDTIPGMVLVYAVLNLPFAVWLTSSFFEEVPAEIEESALIDGCSRLQAFRKVVLPLVVGGLAVTALFTFIMSWNEFIFALALTQSEAATAPRSLTGFFTEFGGIEWGRMSAAGVVMIVPILVAASLLQKHIVRGLTFGAVKG